MSVIFFIVGNNPSRTDIYYLSINTNTNFFRIKSDLKISKVYESHVCLFFTGFLQFQILKATAIIPPTTKIPIIHSAIYLLPPTCLLKCSIALVLIRLHSWLSSCSLQKSFPHSRQNPIEFQGSGFSQKSHTSPILLIHLSLKPR